VQVKDLTIEHCQAIANLHVKSFDSFFLTSLGSQFLKVFYRAIINDSNGIAIGIFEEKQLVAFSNILKSSVFSLLFAAFPQLILDPRKIFRLIQSFTSHPTEDPHIADSASLLSICVDPSMGNKGYGKKILAAFEERVFLSATTISLTTDAENNDAVNRFYIANGYVLFNEFLQSTRRMNLYYKNNEK
jgi:GNAT superfamily N-acetyltransferase